LDAEDRYMSRFERQELTADEGLQRLHGALSRSASEY
jgi:hypothetical protein